MKMILKNNSAITLIALVITVIILLILSGISIVSVTGENGILTKAIEANKQTEIAVVKEQAKLDIINWLAMNPNEESNIIIDSPEKIKEILDTMNKNNANKYYSGYTDTGIKTPSGYEVAFEELYTIKSQEQETTQISIANYGDRVDYVSKGDNSLIWRIFYHNDYYVYLISSKADGSNPIESCDLSNVITDTKYNDGSETVQKELRYLNSEWFNIIGNIPNTTSNAKAVAYLMDQDVWDEYKDVEGKASYAIGSPTFELYINSFNSTAESNGTTSRIDKTCTEVGYSFIYSKNTLLSSYNNGIYNNSTLCFLASPNSTSNNRMITIYGATSSFTNNTVDQNRGLRPVVIIPRDSFTFKILND